MAEQLVLKDHFGGVVTRMVSATVVSRDERGQLLWIPIGAAARRPALDRPIREIPRDDWPDGGFPLVDEPWDTFHVLALQPTGANHSVWWFFAPDGEFQNWYVNLETRTPDGSEITDKELDIWVYPDRSWEWKDVESFEQKTGDPRFWDADEAAEVRAEGERVIKLIEAGDFPFDGTWCDFRPDPSWPVPSLEILES